MEIALPAPRKSDMLVAAKNHVDLPRYLGGFRVRDLEHAFGRKKAGRIIAWLASGAGPNVIAFPIDRTTGPAMTCDRATGAWSRVKAPVGRNKHKPVVAPFRPSGDAA